VPTTPPERQFDDRETETAADRYFVAAAKEAFGDAGQLLLGDTGTIILDDHLALFGGAGHTTPDDASGRRMVHSVLHQIPGSKSEQIRLDVQLDAVKIRGNLDRNAPGRIC
jgi:N-acetylglucosamine kinase-like BadF-type ATPase